MHGSRSQGGQASVELVALLPALVVVCAVAWQVVLAGHAAWSVSSAARAAARAEAIGTDPDRAARAALPPSLERGLRVKPGKGGAVEVRVRVPAVGGWLRLGSVGATAHFAPQT